MNQVLIDNLEKKYNEIVEQYGENSILWISSPVYNLEKQTELSINICYIPSEEELYCTLPAHNNNIIDIRKIISIFTTDSSYAIDFVLTPYKIINPIYKDYANDEFFTILKLFLLEKDEKMLKKVKKTIKEIIKKSIEKQKIKEEDLINILTKTELKVLKFILEDFKGNSEGDIKVSQATNKYNISTSVFRTLFYKMKEYQIATIDSRGVKGTHISFNNIEILKSLID